jgi:hypothetical protein
VNRADFSVFESESFALFVDRQRLQITAKKRGTSALESLQHFGMGYVREQSHIPYRALGLDFEWILEAAVGEALPIAVSVGDVGDLSSIRPMAK